MNVAVLVGIGRRTGILKMNWRVAYKDSGLDMMKPIMCAESSDPAQALCKSSPAILGIDCIV